MSLIKNEYGSVGCDDSGKMKDAAMKFRSIIANFDKSRMQAFINIMSKELYRVDANYSKKFNDGARDMMRDLEDCLKRLDLWAAIAMSKYSK